MKSSGLVVVASGRLVFLIVLGILALRDDRANFLAQPMSSAPKVDVSTENPRERPASSESESEVLNEHLVFLSEDIDMGLDGCDAVSVMSVLQNERIHAGRLRPSPGRMAANPNLSLVLATGNQGGIAGDDGSVDNRLYAVFKSPNSSSGWDDTFLKGDRHLPPTSAGIAITRDGDHILVATQSAQGYCIGLNPGSGKSFSVSKYRVDQVDLENHAMGPEVDRIDLEAPVAAIVPSEDGMTAHLVMVPHSGITARHAPAVVTIDIATMRERAARIPLASIGSPQVQCRDGWTPMGLTHATISPDGRFLVTNRWLEGGLNVADLEARTSWTIDLRVDAHRFTGGVAFNHGWRNTGLLAVHNMNRVVIYRWVDGKHVDELLRIGVSAPVEYDPVSRQVSGSNGRQSGPIGSVAWSGSGDDLIAAVRTRAAPDFQSWQIEDDGRTAVPARRYNACSYVRNAQNHILTGNGLLPTRTPTASQVPTSTTTPTATPEPSSTSTLTATPTKAVPSATPTATSPPPTITPLPTPLFLPLSLRESCSPTKQQADIVLVLDASSSMTGSKLVAAKNAATTFVSAVSLPDDRIGVVAFNDQATELSGLSGDAGVIEAAIASIQPNPGTRIDRGLERAIEVLDEGARGGDHPEVIVLLTDGRQTEEPDRALDIAQDIRDEGTRIYAIGLGKDVDDDFLRQIAGAGARYYFAPDESELEAIYEQIAATIPCPAEDFWGRR